MSGIGTWRRDREVSLLGVPWEAGGGGVAMPAIIMSDKLRVSGGRWWRLEEEEEEEEASPRSSPRQQWPIHRCESFG
ncbi:hypothetical protein E2C01_073909 [Portunus trituberculatus]|uniref:Uncharacterized protein n=1 Tax=Portunus trituberculatus TaxID=210409 RepID=A0A5B7IAQ8_PORTR|nr:hypothetical protein [Portunus trituberculatus]